MICPICSTENRDTAKFCDECGYRFSPEDAPVADAIEADGQQPGAAEGQKPEPADDFLNADYTTALPALGFLASDSPSDASDGEPAGQGAQGDQVAAVGPDDAADPLEPVREIDLSGFVFDSDEVNEAVSDAEQSADAASPHEDDPGFQSFETRAIPAIGVAAGAAAGAGGAAWRAGSTEVIPRLDEQEAPSSLKVSAPANKKEERARKRAMKKQDREARKKLKGAQKKQGKARNGIIIAVLVVLAVAVLAAGVGYYLELWGGKTVPATQGMTEADAIYTLQNEGFTVHVDEIKSDDTAGLVLLSDPAAGARIAEGSEIVIHVAVARTIPSIVGSTYEDAEKALSNEGFTNFADITYEKTDNAKEGTVLEVSPAAGTVAKSNTKISLKIATPYRVPDVTGMSQDNATYALREAGYYVYYSEVETTSATEGTVFATDPEVDTVLSEGSYVTIYVAVQRATKLENAAKSYLNSVGTLTINGTSYVVNAVTSVSYTSNNVVSFTINASPTTVLAGETITLDARSVSGTLTFDSNSQVISVNG